MWSITPTLYAHAHFRRSLLLAGVRMVPTQVNGKRVRIPQAAFNSKLVSRAYGQRYDPANAQWSSITVLDPFPYCRITRHEPTSTGL